MADNAKPTSVVTITSKSAFLVRTNGKELALAINESDAKSMIDALAVEEMDRLKAERIKVCRQDQDDGKTIIITTQSLGRLMNGNIIEAARFAIVPIPFAALKNCVEGIEEDIEEESSMSMLKIAPAEIEEENVVPN